MPPPTGTHTIDDFKILSHVALKVPKKGSSKTKISSIDDGDSDYEENNNYKLIQPDRLGPAWL
jgi:hypothetical protein